MQCFGAFPIICRTSLMEHFYWWELLSQTMISPWFSCFLSDDARDWEGACISHHITVSLYYLPVETNYQHYWRPLITQSPSTYLGVTNSLIDRGLQDLLQLKEVKNNAFTLLLWATVIHNHATTAWNSKWKKNARVVYHNWRKGWYSSWSRDNLWPSDELLILLS